MPTPPTRAGEALVRWARKAWNYAVVIDLSPREVCRDCTRCYVERLDPSGLSGANVELLRQRCDPHLAFEPAITCATPRPAKLFRSQSSRAVKRARGPATRSPSRRGRLYDRQSRSDTPYCQRMDLRTPYGITVGSSTISSSQPSLSRVFRSTPSRASFTGESRARPDESAGSTAGLSPRERVAEPGSRPCTYSVARSGQAPQRPARARDPGNSKDRG